jgi:tetratricopeptide (TPR) repeat protein
MFVMGSIRGLTVGVTALLVVACATPKRHNGPLPASAPDSVDGLVAAIQADSRQADKTSDGGARAKLADEASAYADACLAKAPAAAGCLYGRGLAYGLLAQAHPLSANDSLKSMLDSLGKAETADPNYDHAGPSRVRALVLVRAPGWPVGPGDADTGLTSARHAVELQPDYPPNQLALGEALAKTGDANGAREAYGKARDIAQGLPASEDRDGWLRDATQGLQRK